MKVLFGELPPSRFVTWTDLTECGCLLARTLARENITSVIGVPRSGLFLANLIAVYLHIPLFAFDQKRRCLRTIGAGGRLPNSTDLGGNPVLVDDTVSSGRTLNYVWEVLRGHYGIRNCLKLVAYSSEWGEGLVDMAGWYYERPHYLEWCFVNTFWARSFAYDFDGVLCEDFVGGDATQYKRHLEEAKALYVPRLFPIFVVSARLEETRNDCLVWLAKHGVSVKSLILWERDEHSRWQSATAVAEWKSLHLRRLRSESGVRGFIESDPFQAEWISRAASMPVLCPMSKTVYAQHLHLWK